MTALHDGTRLVRVFTRPRGDPRWDWMIRGLGVLGLVGIPLVLLVPASVPLVWFALMCLPANSPLSPIIPAAFEPVIMEAAKHSPAYAVTLVGLAGYMYTEVSNYHLYRWVLTRQRFAKLHAGRWVEWGIRRFERAPFTTIAIFAFTPLPFWVARCLAIMTGYSRKRYYLATALGKLPNIAIYAVAGAVLQVPSLLLLAVLVGTAAIAIGLKVARGERLLEDAALAPRDDR